MRVAIMECKLGHFRGLMTWKSRISQNEVRWRCAGASRSANENIELPSPLCWSFRVGMRSFSTADSVLKARMKLLTMFRDWL